MQNIDKLLESITTGFVSILDTDKITDTYVALDLSTTNKELENVDITNADDCESYIQKILEATNSTVAYGGYLEKRNLYAKNANFSKEVEVARDIHLGVDFWAKVGTKVIAPLKGVVHSFKNNAVTGDYGPTIILKHIVNGVDFYSLYGHLALSSLDNIYIGKEYSKGSVIGTLGTADVNVGYAPHLHFQLIIDIEENKGDYPGVCNVKDVDYYAKNCPNPNLLLHIE